MVRFHLEGSRDRLLDLPYSDYFFLVEELSLRAVTKKRDHLEAVSFGAFQIATFKGYKKSWEHYKKSMGFKSGAESKKVDKEERADVIKNACSIHENLMRARDVKKKNI